MNTTNLNAALPNTTPIQPVEPSVDPFNGAVSNRVENTIRTFMVRQLNFGYVVEVGCHSFAIETKEKLVKLVSDYINTPDETEKKWFETKQL